MRGGLRRTKHGGNTWGKNHGVPKRKWGKHGGNNVGEGETKNFSKKIFPGEKKRVGLHFSFPPVFSPTYFPHIFPHVKTRRRRPIIIIIYFLYFFIRKRRKK
jgi:hypothetical protein